MTGKPLNVAEADVSQLEMPMKLKLLLASIGKVAIVLTGNADWL